MIDPPAPTPPAAIRIRAFMPGDEARLHEVFVASIDGLTGDHYDQAQREAWLGGAADVAKWNARIQRIQPFVAMRDGVVAGYADLQPDGLIDHFFVAAGHARHGVGDALMRHLQQRARLRGIIELHAQVSLSAESFFARHGFTVEQRQTVHVSGVALANALMRKALDSRDSAAQV